MTTMTLKQPNTVAVQTIPNMPIQIYARGGYRVLPLLAGFAVVGRDGDGREIEIDRYGVGDVDGAVGMVDELVGKVA